VLNIAIAKSPWVQETESRGIGKRLVRQHHLLHNESSAICQQMLTCSLSESPFGVLDKQTKTVLDRPHQNGDNVAKLSRPQKPTTLEGRASG
jgi:hypothetical protein